MRRTDICLYIGPADRAELQALLTNRNTPRKLTWRAGFVLGTADGVGTVEIMRQTGIPLCQRSCPPLNFSYISQVGGIEQ